MVRMIESSQFEVKPKIEKENPPFNLDQFSTYSVIAVV